MQGKFGEYVANGILFQYDGNNNKRLEIFNKYINISL